MAAMKQSQVFKQSSFTSHRYYIAKENNNFLRGNINLSYKGSDYQASFSKAKEATRHANFYILSDRGRNTQYKISPDFMLGVQLDPQHKCDPYDFSIGRE